MSRHARQDDEDDRRAPALSPTTIRRLAYAAIVAGVAAGTAALTWAAVFWAHEELITERGWIVIGGTTICALGCFLGPFGLARARDREHQEEADAAVERLAAIADVLEPLVEPLLATADLVTDLAAVAGKVEQNTRLLVLLHDEDLSVIKRVALRVTSQDGLAGQLNEIQRSIATIERTHDVFDRVVQAVIRSSVPLQARRGDEAPEPERDAAWLADMAETLELGKEMGRRERDHRDEDD